MKRREVKRVVGVGLIEHKLIFDDELERLLQELMLLTSHQNPLLSLVELIRLMALHYLPKVKNKRVLSHGEDFTCKLEQECGEEIPAICGEAGEIIGEKNETSEASGIYDATQMTKITEAGPADEITIESPNQNSSIRSWSATTEPNNTLLRSTSKSMCVDKDACSTKQNVVRHTTRHGGVTTSLHKKVTTNQCGNIIANQRSIYRVNHRVSRRASHQAIHRPSPQNNRRPIPAKMQRYIWLRDQGRCQHMDPLTGKICASTYRVQIDHIRRVSEGGLNTINNLRLYCQAHNLYKG